MSEWSVGVEWKWRRMNVRMNGWMEESECCHTQQVARGVTVCPPCAMCAVPQAWCGRELVMKFTVCASSAAVE